MSNWNTYSLTYLLCSFAYTSMARWNESLALLFVKLPFNMGIKWYGNAIFQPAKPWTECTISDEFATIHDKIKLYNIWAGSWQFSSFEIV